MAKLVIASNFVMNLKSTINDVRRTGIRDIKPPKLSMNEKREMQ